MPEPAKHVLRTLSAWVSPEVFGFVGCECGWHAQLAGAYRTVPGIKKDLRTQFEAHLTEHDAKISPEDAGSFE